MSAGERQSFELMDKVKQHLRAMKLACSESSVIHETGVKSLEIEIPGVTRITAIPANPETARGFTGDIFLDEFAIHSHDKDIWAAMLPTITRNEGEIDIASTPKGCKNLFAKFRDNKLFHHDTVTIHDAVAAGVDIDVDALRLLCDDDEIWQQEYLCKFIDGASIFIPYDKIVACADSTININTTPMQARSYNKDLFMGIDIGRRHDLTVVWILSADPEQGGGVRTEAVMVLEKTSFAVQRDMIREWLHNANIAHVSIDETGIGMQLAEELVEEFGRFRVEPVTFTANRKAGMANAIRTSVLGGSITIPDDEDIFDDFYAVQKTLTPDGNIKIGSPRTSSGHSDRFWAAALALRSFRCGQSTEIAIGHSKTTLRNNAKSTARNPNGKKETEPAAT